MVAMREAIKNAKDYVREVYADDPPKDLHLEEVKREDDDSAWIVTVGFRAFSIQEAKNGIGALNELFPQDAYRRFPREYKVITINATSGEVVSMVNREQ